MPEIPEKLVLSSEVTIQTRRAQAVDPLLSSAIQRVCKAASQVAACYLLDGRRQDNGESGLIIALTVDEESEQMGSVAQQFQVMLAEFPSQAAKTVIMSSARFADRYAGTEFYTRGVQQRCEVGSAPG